MADARERFDAFKKEFRNTEMWKAMYFEHEGSPWHREANVATHTNMLLDWYDRNLASSRNSWQQIMTRTAGLFHDVGKPPSRIIKRSEERGEYRAYHGHEQVSARMWIDYATGEGYSQVRDILCLDTDEIAFIALMVEHHVPFALKNVAKRKALKAAFFNRMDVAGHRAWLDLLLSDQHGRISDDQATKLQTVKDWMFHWEQLDWTDGKE